MLPLGFCNIPKRVSEVHSFTSNKFGNFFNALKYFLISKKTELCKYGTI
jgi:hypothetical protein